MRKYIILAALLYSTTLYAADQIIQYNEKMVGANHPTLSDTLNRAFLINHNADGSHQDNVIDNVTGRAATATLADAATGLAANGTTCAAGEAALGVDNQGNAVGCWAPSSLTTVAWDNVTGRDNVTVTTITYEEAFSSSGDNTHKGNISNSGAATNLSNDGDMAFDRSTGQLVVFDNTGYLDTVVLASLSKSYPFGIDNVVAAVDNNLYIWPRIPTKIIVTGVYGCASTDNVVGRLYSCASDNIVNCTAMDNVDWTVTSCTGAGWSDTSLTAGSSAADTWLKWETTSVGTTNSNKLYMTIRYREDY